MNIRDIALVLLVILIWGANFTVIKIGLEEIPPVLFSALRFAIVAIPAVFFIPFPKTSIWNVLGVGIFLGVIKFSLLFVSMDVGVSAGLASLLLQAQVVFTIVLSVFIFKEEIKKNQFIGIVIAILGFSMFFFSQEGSLTILGLVLILLAALFWAISNLIMKKMKNVDLLHFMVWVSLIPPLPLAILSYFTETNDPMSLLLDTSMQFWLAVLYTGFISTLLAFAIWGYLLKTYSAATVTPFALLIPVVGMLVSSIFLNETLGLIEIIGVSTVMIGLIICVLGNRFMNYFKKKNENQNEKLVKNS